MQPLRTGKRYKNPMEWHIPDYERTYLRELASKQAEYAALPIMAARTQMWYDLNDAKPGARPQAPS